MSTVNSNIQIGKKDAAFFAANPTLVLLDGQLIYNDDTGDLFIGDGVTQLNALVAINGGGGGVWGSITGTLSNQTDLQNALNAKLNASEKSTSADQVVITNGSNVLTSLSLGASQSIRRNAANNAFEAYTPSLVASMSKIYSGEYKCAQFFGQKTATTGWNNFIYFIPYFINESHTITELGANVVTGAAGSNISLAAYTDLNGEPNTLLEQSGSISAVSSGFKSFVLTTPISLTPSDKVLWLGIQLSSASISISQGIASHMIGKKQSLANDNFRISQAFGSFPASATGLIDSNFNNPSIWVKVQ